MKQFSWWKQPHAEGDLSGGLHCIALYQPLRGFYCDLHVNEHLSVCSRYHFSRGQCSFSVSKTDLSDKRVKLSILCSKASFTHVTVFASVWVFSHTWCRQALWPWAQDRWMVAGELKGDSQRWMATHSPVQASFFVVCVCACVCVCVCVKHKVERTSGWQGL